MGVCWLISRLLLLLGAVTIGRCSGHFHLGAESYAYGNTSAAAQDIRREYGGFPCNLGGEVPSTYSAQAYPTSAHNLRPQDIGIIGALGDSLTAGTGARARNIFEVVDENRGVSFATGGEGNWQTAPTLANLFRVYNPALKGASYGNTKAIMIPFQKETRGERGLNLSSSGARAQQIPEMARMLVDKVRRIPDWQHQWKLITILIGHNDLCSYSCNNTLRKLGLSPAVDTSPYSYRNHIQTALDILRENLPRTVVVLIGMADVTMALDLVDKPPVCFLTHIYECPCLFEHSFAGDRRRVQHLVHQYRQVMYRLSKEPRFNTDTFTVEYLPTMEGELPREIINGRLSLDLNLLAPDCFHFMKNLHGIVARNLWNNLLQPEGHRTMDYRLVGPLVCPSERAPYLALSSTRAYPASSTQETLPTYLP